MLKIVRSLSFAQDRREELRDIPDSDWPGILAMTDASRLTLPLAIRCIDRVPGFVRARLDRNLTNNAKLHRQRVAEHAAIAQAFGSRGVEYIVLKGFAQWPAWCEDLRHRPQYDIDLYCPPESIEAACGAASSLGYVAARKIGKNDGARHHHLPVMIRDTGWRWRGDYYDPARPSMLEIHSQFWSASREGFDVCGADELWRRRTARTVAGLTIAALDPCGNLCFNAWHIVRHLLHGNLCLYHVYELAYFLHLTAGDDGFWREWSERGSPSERIVEAIAFRLAMEWFQCNASDVAQRYVTALPAGIGRWFDLFAFSPLSGARDPNKDEIFLHLCLVRGSADRLRIARKRILPSHSAAPMGAREAAHRSIHHLRALAPLVRSAVRWIT